MSYSLWWDSCSQSGCLLHVTKSETTEQLIVCSRMNTAWLWEMMVGGNRSKLRCEKMFPVHKLIDSRTNHKQTHKQKCTDNIPGLPNSSCSGEENTQLTAVMSSQTLKEYQTIPETSLISALKGRLCSYRQVTHDVPGQECHITHPT